MSKKYKKQNKQEEIFKKNIIYDDVSFLDKNNMDHTQFFNFQHKDFIINQNPLFWSKIQQDLTYLLQQSFPNFWATIKFNIYLQNCLESFLRYACKKEIPKIHRLFFLVFSRIIFHSEENKELSNCFDINNVIYDLYLLDVPKFFDIIKIYPNNKEIVKKMIKQVFDQNYNENFKMSIDLIEKKILKVSLEQIQEITTKQKFEEDFIINDKRVCQVLMLDDCLQNLNNSLEYFNKECLLNYINNHNLLSLIENLYYQIDQAIKIWQCQDFLKYFYKIKYYIVQFFVNLLKFWSKQDQKIQIKVFDFLEDFGKQIQFGKKGERNYVLLKHICKRFDLEEFLMKQQFKDDEKLVKYISIISSLKSRNQDEEDQSQSQSDQEEIEIEIQKEIENQIEHQVQESNQKIQLELVQKKEIVQDYQLSKEERHKIMNQVRIQMEEEYNDDFDDGFMFKMKFENNQEEILNNDSGDSDLEQDQQVDQQQFKKIYQKNPYQRNQQDQQNQQKQQNQKYSKTNNMRVNQEYVYSKYQNEPDDCDQTQKKKDQYKHYTQLVQKQQQEQKLVKDHQKRDQGYVVEKYKKQKYKKQQ